MGYLRVKSACAKEQNEQAGTAGGRLSRKYQEGRCPVPTGRGEWLIFIPGWLGEAGTALGPCEEEEEG